jgi:N-6 DNA Methylase
MKTLLDDPTNLADNVAAYVRAFSSDAQDVLEKFEIFGQVDRLDRADLLYLVVSKFCDIDLHPEAVSNLEMGYLYEELIRRFSELSNETAGEYFTPREVIRLMVNLLFIADDELLTPSRRGEDDARPGLRHRRHAQRRRGPSAFAEPEGAAGDVRPGTQRRVVRDLPVGHDAQGRADLGDLVGVADDGAVHGLAGDYASLHKMGKDDRDLFLLHLGQLMVTALGETIAGAVSTQLHTVDGADLCRVHVRPSSFPVDAKVVVEKAGQLQKKTAFYIRVGNSTREITDAAERRRYVASHLGAGQH